MGKCIRSKFNDMELLEMEGVNQVFRSFELIGVFSEFNTGNHGNDLEQYYLNCVMEKKYRYRNAGVRIIYNIIEDHRKTDKEIPYRISKKSMYRYGITYFGSRIIVYETSALVLDLVLDYIKNIKELYLIYRKYIDKSTILDYLDFQEMFLKKYVAGGGTNQREKYADVRNSIKQLIEVKE